MVSISKFNGYLGTWKMAISRGWYSAPTKLGQGSDNELISKWKYVNQSWLLLQANHRRLNQCIGIMSVSYYSGQQQYISLTCAWTNFANHSRPVPCYKRTT